MLADTFRATMGRGIRNCLAGTVLADGRPPPRVLLVAEWNMRIAVLSLAIVGSLFSAILGAKWISDAKQSRANLEQAVVADDAEVQLDALASLKKLDSVTR